MGAVMSQEGRYLRRMRTGFAHWCAGCHEMHVFSTDVPNTRGARWTFNGDLEKPGFIPSMNIRTGRYADPGYRPDPGEPDDSMVCHYTITAGEVQFHNDCTHALKGQKTPMPELPTGLTDAPG